jgi:DNA primase
VLAVYAAVPGVAAAAPCGTAFTKSQAEVLAAAGVVNLVVAFDADEGGLTAAAKAYETLRPHIETALFARLPDGTDPAALAETDPTKLARTLTEGLVPLSNAVVDNRIARWRGTLDSVEGRSLAPTISALLISTMPAADVPHQVARTADLIGVLHETTTAIVADAISPDKSPMPRPTGVMAMNSARPEQVAIARTAFSKEESATWPRDRRLEDVHDRRSQFRSVRGRASDIWSPMTLDR